MSACTSSAARLALTRRRHGHEVGQQAAGGVRERWSRAPAPRSTSGCTGSRSRRSARRCPAQRRAAEQQAATLSGCPSRAVTTAHGIAVDPHRRRGTATRRVDPRRPRGCRGPIPRPADPVLRDHAQPGGVQPSSSQAARRRARRDGSRRGRSPAPTPRTSRRARRGDGELDDVVAVSAMPAHPKAGPRLALVAGTRTRATAGSARSRTTTPQLPRPRGVDGDRHRGGRTGDGPVLVLERCR